MKNITTLIIIIAVLSCAGASIFLAVRSNRRKNRILDMYNAARKLVKEQNLNASLREDDRNKKRERVRMIVALSWKQTERESFVFDPLEGVRIGRECTEREGLLFWKTCGLQMGRRSPTDCGPAGCVARYMFTTVTRSGWAVRRCCCMYFGSIRHICNRTKRFQKPGNCEDFVPAAAAVF